MELQKEWLEFLGLLTRHRVRYVMVGGLAVAAHGRVRYTKDLDVLVDPSNANARRVGRALADFGFAASARSWRRLTIPYQVLTLGREPIRIDILTGIAGMTFARVWRGRVTARLATVDVPVIGFDDLRVNKLAAGRPQDLFDVALLDELTKVVTRAASRSRSTRRRPAAPRSRTRGTAAPRTPKAKPKR